MKKQWSIEETVASLEAEAAVHRERRDHFAGQEAFYREHRSHHKAELEAITRRLEAFRAASAALEFVARLVPRSGPPNDGEDIGPASKPRLTKIVETILAELGPEQAVGPAWLTQEVNRRHGERLRKRVTPPPDLRRPPPPCPERTAARGTEGKGAVRGAVCAGGVGAGLPSSTNDRRARRRDLRRLFRRGPEASRHGPHPFQHRGGRSPARSQYRPA